MDKTDFNFYEWTRLTKTHFIQLPNNKTTEEGPQNCKTKAQVALENVGLFQSLKYELRRVSLAL